MRSLWRAGLLGMVWMVWEGTPSVRAEGPETVPGAVGLHPILVTVFEEVKAFSALATVHLSGAASEASMEMPMKFWYREGDMRAEIDMGEVQSSLLPPELRQNLRQIGMDRVITIMHKDSRSNLVLYPNLRAGVVAAPAQAAADPGKGRKPARPAAKVRQERIGEETVLGRSCEKYRFIEEKEGAAIQEAWVWRDPSLKGFPVQIEVEQSGGRMRVTYRDIELKRPDRSLFELPKGYRQFATMEAVMKDALEQLLRGEKP